MFVSISLFFSSTCSTVWSLDEANLKLNDNPQNINKVRDTEELKVFAVISCRFGWHNTSSTCYQVVIPSSWFSCYKSFGTAWIRWSYDEEFRLVNSCYAQIHEGLVIGNQWIKECWKKQALSTLQIDDWRKTCHVFHDPHQTSGLVTNLLATELELKSTVSLLPYGCFQK